MIVYLAGVKNIYKQIENPKGLYILTSFIDFQNSKSLPDFLYGERHITDSGAFSTFKDINEAKNKDWDGYMKKYISFLKEIKAKLYFELDIDAVVGLNKVEYYRKQLEDATGVAPIPVWHSNRKWDYFEMMCENYPYVSIGTTTATNEGSLIRKNPAVLKKFIQTAHNKGAKIHGLGFTDTKWLKVLDFDSVDSTSHVCHKYGQLHYFNGSHIEVVKRKNKDDKMIGKTSDYHILNINEWIKYQKYMLNK
jgi:hypothetical protein